MISVICPIILTGLAVLDKFQISCPFWVDEGANASRSEFDTGHRLMYEYVLITNNETSLLYYGGKSRLNIKWRESVPSIITSCWFHSRVVCISVLCFKSVSRFRHQCECTLNGSKGLYRPFGSFTYHLRTEEVYLL